MCGEEEGGKKYVDAFVGETGWHGGAFFFGFGEEDGEFLDGGHGDVAAVVAGEEGLEEVVSGFARGLGGMEGLALPLRSRKNMAEAMVVGCVGLVGRWGLGRFK